MIAQIWDAVPQIGTGLSLVAFVVAAALFAYRARLKHREAVIGKMSPRDKLAAIDATAEFLRVDVSGLSAKDKHDIVVRQLAIRARRELMLAGIALAIAILLGVVAVIALWQPEANKTPVVQCYEFDPQTGEQKKSLGLRPCIPGKVVFLKYWDPNNYDPTMPRDRANRVFQAKGLIRDHVRWTEHNLTSVDGPLEDWSSQSHDWVTVVEDISIGGGQIGFVLRRIDLQPIPVGGGKNQCDVEDGKRAVLEFAFPRDSAAQIADGRRPTVRMRWILVSCLNQVGEDPLVGPDFKDTKWPIVAAISDPT
jgi:hypothetical protein